jgi:hypothetical protein
MDSEQLHFLALPWEIRNLIYVKLFEEDYEVPESPAELKKTWFLFPFWLANSSFIHAPPPARSICQGLLGCCRQVRQEVLQRLERERKKRQLRCKLDCMALRNGELFPSWLWLPAPLRYIDVLEVDVRVIPADGEIEGAAVPPPPDRFLNDPSFKMSELIEEFFTRGPSYRPVKVLRTDIEVKELIINIIPPSSVPEDILHDRRICTSGRLPDGSVHPEKIFQAFSGNYLLQRILRGRMKELIVRYEGRVYRWNAAEDDVPRNPRARKANRVMKAGRRRGGGGSRTPR